MVHGLLDAIVTQESMDGRSSPVSRGPDDSHGTLAGTLSRSGL